VHSRGLALAITACTPAVTAAAIAPLLTLFIEAYGWRAGYVGLAAMVGVAGAIALLLIPQGAGDGGAKGRTIAHDYPALMRDRTFQILCASKLLCSIALMVMTSQLKLVLLDRNLESEVASLLISGFAVATIAGRFFGGLALDRFPSHIIGLLGFGIAPAIGFFILGIGLQGPLLLGAAVLILGVAFGADGNITAYLVMRFFRFEIFSTVYSLISVAIAVSAAGGALLLSVTLKASGGSQLFFLIASAMVLAGGSLVLLLGRQPAIIREAAPAA
ncbi:MAG: nitrate/nitrite transporter, partial [Nevskiales bacterium]